MCEKTRLLTSIEIENLIKQGCRAIYWGEVLVSEDFLADNIFDVRFGKNVIICGKVTISCAKIENTIIHDGVHIENVGAIVCSNDSNFGIGIKVNVVNENGGRAIPMYKGITAQSAYILAMHRHKTELFGKFERLIDEQQQNCKKQNIIGKDSRLLNCTTIDGVHLGSNTIIEGALMIKNGSTSDNVKLGHGVILQDFMCEKGAVIQGASQLKRCFIGECAHIDSGFSAVDSAFFAMCDMANGECCSVFAGPYTVSHHKSSLLIAGLFSFFNAGSGTNQSNHLFKTGAVHQAIHERGCKYGSNAYIMAPARTGAYNVVLSRHTSHHDTTDFPFSYLVENDGKSTLMPGAALRSSGTDRDITKWQQRDKREGEKLDLINFERWNPYIGAKLLRAIEVSENLLEKDADSYSHGRVKISASMLKRGLSVYKMALNATLSHILSSNAQANSKGADQWIDLAGLYAPKDVIDKLEVVSLEQFHKDLTDIFNTYNSYALGWARNIVGENADFDQIIEQGKKDADALKALAQSDLKQDFSTLMQTGYGIDESDKELQIKDFEIVRGL